MTSPIALTDKNATWLRTSHIRCVHIQDICRTVGISCHLHETELISREPVLRQDITLSRCWLVPISSCVYVPVCVHVCAQSLISISSPFESQTTNWNESWPGAQRQTFPSGCPLSSPQSWFSSHSSRVVMQLVIIYMHGS